MRRIAPGTLAGLVVGAVLAAPALAAPANVAVRVEGDAATLVPRTAVATTAAPVGKDGRTCSGTSALGALDRATAGDWAGDYFDDFSSWFVETIMGETHASNEAGYWALWVNHRFSDLGLCGTELQEGDDLVLAPNGGPILELAGVPATAAPGTVATVAVTAHGVADPDAFPTVTVSAPAAGVTVAYGAERATTRADGTARLRLNGPGQVAVQATKAGHIRSAVVTACVTGSDDACDSPVRDTTAPEAEIAALPRGKVFSRRRAPRQVSGTVSPDPSGIRSVRLSIVRKRGERCWAFDGRRERFARHRCGGSKSFRLGDRAEWSYLLPHRLRRGRYTIRVVAIDRAGNAAATATRIRVR